jgi:hypothetical protein
MLSALEILFALSGFVVSVWTVVLDGGLCCWDFVEVAVDLILHQTSYPKVSLHHTAGMNLPSICNRDQI